MIRYTEEPLSHCQADIESLLPEQWAETGEFGIDCAPNWPMYYALEQKNALLLLMARDDAGVPIGFLTGVVIVHPNSAPNLAAVISTYFIRKRSGRALYVRSLLSHGVNLALERGAWKITVKTEYNHSAGRILEAMGFAPKAIEFVMARSAEEKAHA